MMGRSKDVYHAQLAEVDDVPRIGMDYMRVSEHGINSVEGGSAGDVCVTVLFVKDFLHSSISVYPVEGRTKARFGLFNNATLKSLQR